jgi:hypothetical protein
VYIESYVSPSDPSKEGLTPSRLIDMIISHAVRNSLSGNPTTYWIYIDILTSLWRSMVSLIVLKGSHFNDLSTIFRKLAKTHHTMIQSMSVDQKNEYFQNRLVLPHSVESHVEIETTWISKAIELATPYLRDDNQ